jgi:hypothetical protein
MTLGAPGWDGDRFMYKACEHNSYRIRSLMMTEAVSETSDTSPTLARLIAREDFIWYEIVM